MFQGMASRVQVFRRSVSWFLVSSVSFVCVSVFFVLFAGVQAAGLGEAKDCACLHTWPAERLVLQARH